MDESVAVLDLRSSNRELGFLSQNSDVAEKSFQCLLTDITPRNGQIQKLFLRQLSGMGALERSRTIILFRQVGMLPSLEEIVFDGLEVLSPDVLDCLFPAASHVKRIVFDHIREGAVSDPKVLVEGLSRFSSLQSIAWRGYMPSGLRRLVEPCFAKLFSLRGLRRVTLNALDLLGSYTSFKRIIRYSEHSRIQSLELLNCNAADKLELGAAIASCITRTKTIKSLTLQGFVKPDVARVIFASFVHNKSIRSLDIRGLYGDWQSDAEVWNTLRYSLLTNHTLAEVLVDQSNSADKEVWHSTERFLRLNDANLRRSFEIPNLLPVAIQYASESSYAYQVLQTNLQKIMEPSTESIPPCKKSRCS